MPKWGEAAVAANQRACDAIDARQFVDAIEPAVEAARLAPTWAAPWWNLVVAYKHANRWRDCVTAADRALALSTDDVTGLHWCAAIAATAIGDWDRARTAWRSAGVPIPNGHGPIQMDLGATPVRVGGSDDGEVLWCDRIDPCRAVVVSVPLPDSGRRCGDLLLHDGEPRGTRQLGERTVSVFDELALLAPSTWGTWQIELDAATPQERDEILALVDGGSIHAEDWTESIQLLCKACSLGDPHHTHDHAKVLEPVWKRERLIGVGAASEDELRPLKRWIGGWRKPITSVRRVL